ncbi:MAG: hypothetical protein QXU98_10295, partial [Candidatus Parvarchaeota archaeon]
KVLDLGMVPIAVPAFASFKEKTYGVCLTASHNPPKYTGILTFDNGKSLDPERIKSIYSSKSFLSGEGTIKKQDYQSKYLLRITKGINGVNFKVGIDAMGGAGTFASKLAVKLIGAEPKMLHPNISMDFFGKTPEPSKENISELSSFVEENHLDMGMQLDGDADRVIFTDEHGNFIDPVISALIFVRYLHIEEAVINVMSPSIFKRFTKVKFVAVGRNRLEGVEFGFETSSHFYFGKYFPASDGILTSILMLNILKKSGKTMSELAKEFPRPYYKLEAVKMRSSEEMDAALKEAEKRMSVYGRIDRTDGAKVYFDDGSICVRKSETEPLIRVFYEGVDESSFMKMGEIAYKIMPWK